MHSITILVFERCELPGYCSCRLDLPLEEPDDRVSNELSLWSDDVEGAPGTGGTISAGANRPFFIGVDDRPPEEKRCFAFGVDTMRRMKCIADAPMARGDKGSERLEDPE
jgi:hypothetical protein